MKICNENPTRAGKDGPCVLYAIGNHVVLPRRITGPRAPAKTIAEAIRLIGPVRAEEAARSPPGLAGLWSSSRRVVSGAIGMAHRRWRLQNEWHWANAR